MTESQNLKKKLVSKLEVSNVGTGLNCTKPKFHLAKFARGHNIARRRFCTKGQFCTSYIFRTRVKNINKK